MTRAITRFVRNVKHLTDDFLTEMETEAVLAEAAEEPGLAKAIRAIAAATASATAESIEIYESATQAPDVAPSADHLLSDQSPTEGGPMI